MEYRFTGKIWEYSGKGSWHFITLPKEYSEAIKEISSSVPKKSFGSIKVEVTIGSSIWKTSIFPDSNNGVYLLPLKKSIRTIENIIEGQKLKLNIKLLDF